MIVTTWSCVNGSKRASKICSPFGIGKLYSIVIIEPD